MKRKLLILLALCGLHITMNAQNQMAALLSGKKILVAYFSCTGTTGKVAEAIAETTGGTLYEITPATPYTAADLNWQNQQSRSSVEMADSKSRPALGGKPLEADKYDVVFLGYPVWWDLCPRVVNTFIEKYGFSGKTVIPFATSGSSTITNSVRQLKQLYPAIRWTEGKLLNGGRRQAIEWVKSR